MSPPFFPPQEPPELELVRMQLSEIKLFNWREQEQLLHFWCLTYPSYLVFLDFPLLEPCYPYLLKQLEPFFSLISIFQAQHQWPLFLTLVEHFISIISWLIQFLLFYHHPSWKVSISMSLSIIQVSRPFSKLFSILLLKMALLIFSILFQVAQLSSYFQQVLQDLITFEMQILSFCFLFLEPILLAQKQIQHHFQHFLFTYSLLISVLAAPFWIFQQIQYFFLYLLNLQAQLILPYLLLPAFPPSMASSSLISCPSYPKQQALPIHLLDHH